MSLREPSITFKVDVTNPGQFFACCGILELADRLWPGAEGWFENGRFHIACDGTLRQIVDALACSDITSSVGEEGLKRLGTLLSATKATLTADDERDKERLRALWQGESLLLGNPFNLALNWWRNETNERTGLKTWAAKQLILDIVRPLRSAVIANAPLAATEDILQRAVAFDGSSLYFDSHAQSQSRAIDTGFSAYDLRAVIKEGASTRPGLEFFAFIGMQRFRIPPRHSDGTFVYCAWRTPLPALVAALAATGFIRSPNDTCYQFRLLDRTKYMKAFLPATTMENYR